MDRERARGRLRGPLHGVPMVLKDNIDMAGLPTTSGCRALAGAMPHGDAEQTRRLRQAGAIIVGKTNLSEFSFEIRSRSSLGGDVLNPFAKGVTAGGSSGGTAAAVAAGFAVAGLGTDTGGSIRTPAAFNGLVGLRPTQGLIDRRGTAPLAPSTDTVGPMARSVDDLTRLLGVMTATPAMPPGARLGGARIGVARQAFGEDEEIHGAMQNALRVMADSAAILVDPIRLPSHVLPAGRPHVVDWEFRGAFDAYLASNFVAGTAPASLADLLAQGTYLPDYQEAMERRMAVASLESEVYQAIIGHHRALRAAILGEMHAHALDALVYPTSAVVPHSLENPRGGWAPELAACSGLPALTLPVGQARSGVPIGLEFLGPGLCRTVAAGACRRLGRADRLAAILRVAAIARQARPRLLKHFYLVRASRTSANRAVSHQSATVRPEMSCCFLSKKDGLLSTPNETPASYCLLALQRCPVPRTPRQRQVPSLHPVRAAPRQDRGGADRHRRRRCPLPARAETGGMGHTARARRLVAGCVPRRLPGLPRLTRGAIWIMLMHNTASACGTGQVDDAASSARAGRILASGPAQASILARLSATGSVGCQTSSGKAAAKCITCSPVPLAISSTVPVDGRQLFSTSRMGSRLRAADGEKRRGSSGMVTRRLPPMRCCSPARPKADHRRGGSALRPVTPTKPAACM